MKRIFIALAACAAACTGITADAKSLVEQHIDSLVGSTRIINLENNGPRMVRFSSEPELTPEQDSIRNLVQAFYYDQFRHSQDPEAPTFLFMSKSANMLMGIGGVVRMRGWYDWGGAMPATVFAPYMIPIPENPVSTKHLGTTPAGTALFLQMIGRSKLGTYRLYIEANFNGYNTRGLQLKKAYAALGPWTVGYTNSTFSDPTAMAPTVDAQGATNKLSRTDILVRYMPQIAKHWTVAVSLENPSTQIDVSAGGTQAISTWLPDAAAFVQYQWGGGEHVRLAGIVRQLGYRDIAAGVNHNLAGWGVQLSSMAHPHPNATTYVTANYGKGYGGLLNDLLAGNYDLVPDPDVPGKLYAPRSYGYSIGAQYNFSEKLFMSANFSQTRYLPAKDVAGDEYRYGWCADINLFWNVWSRLQVGAEVDLGKRMNMDGTHRYARRAGLMCQFSF